MKQIEKDALRHDGYSYNGCPDHPSGADRWTSNGYGIRVVPNTPEQQAIVDQINAELANQPIPERDGIYLNKGYVAQFPHEKRLEMWEKEHSEARRVVQYKGDQATEEERSRVSFAAMMWKREQYEGTLEQ